MKPIRTQEQQRHEKRIRTKALGMTLTNATHIYNNAYPCVMLEEGRGILHKFVIFFKEGKALAWVKNTEIETIAEFSARRQSSGQPA